MSEKEQREIVNPDDWKESFCGHYYKVIMSEHGPVLYVNQGCEQDALDEAIDYCTEQEWEGLFLDDAERTGIETDGFLEDYVSGGNEGRYLSSLNVYIEEIDG